MSNHRNGQFCPLDTAVLFHLTLENGIKRIVPLL